MTHNRLCLEWNFEDEVGALADSIARGGEGAARRRRAQQRRARGGGFVSVHAANNSFPAWPAYNRMIGLGGWGGIGGIVLHDCGGGGPAFC